MHSRLCMEVTVALVQLPKKRGTTPEAGTKEVPMTSHTIEIDCSKQKQRETHLQVTHPDRTLGMLCGDCEIGDILF